MVPSFPGPVVRMPGAGRFLSSIKDAIGTQTEQFIINKF
ncbi:MAG: hypothetical protein AVDCRST_MAG56-2189 [uncultured Cytophagales bacterium]|uniref:Uncharacterized protein n=1 Tax=uncultured Cytophagales bacterium TaxID=158755 RepID=A0A6J4INI5_9SPHI|nr:MAG: hypothetical protein AVDCRST_MAG56-2189 [uncultured Cytophagales bacterium]